MIFQGHKLVSGKARWSDIAALIETRLNRNVAAQKGTQRTDMKEKLSCVTGPIEVDVISTKGFPLAEEAIRKAVAAEVFKKSVKVATPEYLILLKLLPLSGQDALDIRALSREADMAKVRRLAKKHFLLPKLESVISK